VETVPRLKHTILYATDLHGSESAYVRLLNEAVSTRVDAIVLGGDLTPHSDPAGQALFLSNILRPLLERFRQSNPTIRVFGLLGNDDWIANEPYFNALENDALLFPLHRRAHRLGEHLWIAGSSYVPVTPFGISDWDRLDSTGCEPPKKKRGPLYSNSGKIVSGSMETLLQRPTIEATLTEIAQLSEPSKTVYVIHTPPFNTNLDMMYDDLHIGSAAVRSFIEKHQPPVTVHGHIHESPTQSGSIVDQLGRTVSLNPGDSREALRALVIEIENAHVTWRLLTS
jgi:Icc-related predicted phosphoesterase